MMSHELLVWLTPEERAALFTKAVQERRNPGAQAAIEIRQALERAGYLRPAVNQSLAPQSA